MLQHLTVGILRIARGTTYPDRDVLPDSVFILSYFVIQTVVPQRGWANFLVRLDIFRYGAGLEIQTISVHWGIKIELLSAISIQNVCLAWQLG